MFTTLRDGLWSNKLDDTYKGGKYGLKPEDRNIRPAQSQAYSFQSQANER